MEPLKNRIIKGIKCFQVNDNYLVLERNKTVIIDAAIEFELNTDIQSDTTSPVETSYFTVAFVEESEVLEFRNQDFHSLYTHQNKKRIQLDFLECLVNKQIVAVDYKKATFDAYMPDSNKLLKEDLLVEVLLTFDSGDKLQIAIADYTYENETVSYLYYDRMGEILISLNKNIVVE